MANGLSLLFYWSIAFSLLQDCSNVDGARYSRDACLKGDTPNIPKDHLFHRKKKPLILGHRGQGRQFQENTMEGIKSLIDTGADGFQADVVLTNYGQLVLFQSQNAKKLTGKDKLIWDMTPDEIKKLKYKKTLKYGNKTYKYDKERSVGLLEDLLMAMKDTNMIIYLEMKSMFWDNKTKSFETGKAVGRLIRKLGLEKNVLLTSRDAYKIFAAKRENPGLVIGCHYIKRYWKLEYAQYAEIKKNLKAIPGLDKCLDPLPINSSMLSFLFQTGSYNKALNASFVEFEFGLFSDSEVMKNPVKILKDNYNKNITFGASTIYNMALSESDITAAESKVQNLIDKGVARLITDDVPRLMKKLGRKKPAKSSVRRHISSFVNIFIACFLSFYIIGF